MDELTVRDYIAIFLRRKSIYIYTFLSLFVISSIFVFSWSSYRSSATIQVQAPQISEGMRLPAGTSPNAFMQALADQRIEQINEKVQATTSLVDIITKFDLYSKARRTKPITDIVESMRKKIKLELVSSDLANPSAAQRADPGQLAAIAFKIRFTYSEPLVAQQVTNEIVSRFLDEDLKQRRAQSRETSSFLGNQIAALETTMAEQERKIAVFRSQHADSRPEALAFNQQMAATTSINMQDVERQLAALDKTRGDLRTQLAATDPYSRVLAEGQLLTTPAVQLKALQAKYATLTGQYGPQHPDVVKLRRQIEALQQEVNPTSDSASLRAQLADARTNLAAAEKTYGPDHPDVQSLRREVAALEGRLASDKGRSTRSSAVKRDADNPAYLMLTSQLDAANAQYNALTDQLNRLREQREQYQRAVAKTPAVEQEFASLSRDYDNSQIRYRELKEKKQFADMNEQMEQGRVAERLEVVEPPELPTHTHPPQILLFAVGTVFSLFGGFGGVVVAEAMSRTLKGSRQLSQFAGAPPLVTIAHIYTADERLKIRKVRRIAAVTCLAVVIVAAIIVDVAVIPLDVLWSVALNHLGMS